MFLNDDEDNNLPPPRELYPPGDGNKKRERKLYAKKKMLGAASLYSENGLPIDGLAGSLVGDIKECPRLSKNGGKYIIDWLTYSTGFPSEVDKTKLRTQYDPNEENRLAFDRAIGFYETTGDRINETLCRTFGKTYAAPRDGGRRCVNSANSLAGVETCHTFHKDQTSLKRTTSNIFEKSLTWDTESNASVLIPSIK